MRGSNIPPPSVHGSNLPNNSPQTQTNIERDQVNQKFDLKQQIY
jgi:hypothetical protein